MEKRTLVHSEIVTGQRVEKSGLTHSTPECLCSIFMEPSCRIFYALALEPG